jgi:hypothetical protein
VNEAWAGRARRRRASWRKSRERREEAHRVRAPTAPIRPEQARRGPGLGRSHLGESERRENDAVSWPVPIDTGGPPPCLWREAGWPAGDGRHPPCFDAVLSEHTAGRPARGGSQRRQGSPSERDEHGRRCGHDGMRSSGPERHIDLDANARMVPQRSDRGAARLNGQGHGSRLDRVCSPAAVP